MDVVSSASSSFPQKGVYKGSKQLMVAHVTNEIQLREIGLSEMNGTKLSR